jgi:hypothetical protein
MARIRMHEVSGIARLLFVISLVIGLAISRAVNHPAPAIIGALVGLYFLFAIKVVQQWEKVAVLRLGRSSASAAQACATSSPSSRR